MCLKMCKKTFIKIKRLIRKAFFSKSVKRNLAWPIFLLYKVDIT